MTTRKQLQPGATPPPGTTYVGPPTPWASPYPFSEHGLTEAVSLFAKYALTRTEKDPGWLAPLIGRDLACFCRVDTPCHADVLLDLVNMVTAAKGSPTRR